MFLPECLRSAQWPCGLWKGPCQPLCQGESKGQLLPLGVTHVSVTWSLSALCGNHVMAAQSGYSIFLYQNSLLASVLFSKPKAEEMSRPKVGIQTQGGMVAQLEHPRDPKQKNSKVSLETKSYYKTESKCTPKRDYIGLGARPLAFTL